MACDKSRRTFLTTELFKVITGSIVDGARNDIRDESEYDYFNSFETCYPLLSESGELLMEEALKKGIDVRGKSKVDIAREIFSREETKGS